MHYHVTQIIHTPAAVTVFTPYTLVKLSGEQTTAAA